MNQDILLEFIMVTGLREQEIVETMKQLPISCQEALWFYMYHNRWPSQNEASFIAEVGWEVYELLMRQGVELSNE